MNQISIIDTDDRYSSILMSFSVYDIIPYPKPTAMKGMAISSNVASALIIVSFLYLFMTQLMKLLASSTDDIVAHHPSYSV